MVRDTWGSSDERRKSNDGVNSVENLGVYIATRIFHEGPNSRCSQVREPLQKAIRGNKAQVDIRAAASRSDIFGLE
jgi:hypothetical protein